MTTRTLGQKVADRDAARFVGRGRELELLQALLVEDPAKNVAFVHGPAGIGKSSLLRELARRAAGRGYVVHRIEGRELTPGPDAIEDALAGARGQPRPLLVFDSYERISALGGYLRRAVLPTLAPAAIVVIASRTPPEHGWLEEGWDQVTISLRLGPLGRDEALALLARAGVPAPATEGLAKWARGSPLALTLGAQLPDDARSPDVVSAWTSDRAASYADELLELIARRITDAEWSPEHGPTLAVASIARVVTPALLRDALPGRDADAEFGWLAERSFAESVGEGLAVHELLRVALRQRLLIAEPEREGELRRRICDHLYARAREGHTLLAIDLSHLSQNRAIRWGFSWELGARLRLDDLRADTVEELERALHGTGHRLGAMTRTFLERSPEHVTVVRDERDELRGYTIALTPDSAPAFCADDAFVGPRLEHARRNAGSASVVIWRDVVDLTGDPDSGVIAMLGMAGILRAARGNPRYAYLVINPALPPALAFSHALGAVHVPELDVERRGGRVECHVLDYGPGGLLAAQRDLVYSELGRRPPPRSALQVADPLELVRSCLRHFDEPHRLAATPLARGTTLEERAESVRSLLLGAVDAAFGTRAADQLTRRVLVRAYIDPAPTHELAAEELHLSRSAYFRRLKQATERVATFVSAAPGKRDGAPGS